MIKDLKMMVEVSAENGYLLTSALGEGGELEFRLPITAAD